MRRTCMTHWSVFINLRGRLYNGIASHTQFSAKNSLYVIGSERKGQLTTLPMVFPLYHSISEHSRVDMKFMLLKTCSATGSLRSYVWSMCPPLSECGPGKLFSTSSFYMQMFSLTHYCWESTAKGTAIRWDFHCPLYLVTNPVQHITPLGWPTLHTLLRVSRDAGPHTAEPFSLVAVPEVSPGCPAISEFGFERHRLRLRRKMTHNTAEENVDQKGLAGKQKGSKTTSVVDEMQLFLINFQSSFAFKDFVSLCMLKYWRPLGM